MKIHIIKNNVKCYSLKLDVLFDMCIKYKWQINNTVIEGRRLKFIGTGSSLFMNYIKWWILTIITFGIYGFWLYIKMLQWKTENTIFE